MIIGEIIIRYCNILLDILDVYDNSTTLTVTP